MPSSKSMSTSLLFRRIFTVGALLGLCAPHVIAAVPDYKDYNVRNFGALGDGKTLDSPAINRAIDAAASAGGGTVWFSSGTYLSVSIHLKSNVGLHLDQGAVILAASPRDGESFRYDLPEPNENDQWQDFGHTHFQNSLIWGENLENISILGPGLINGAGLVRHGSQSRDDATQDALKGKAPAGRARNEEFGYPDAADAVEPGWGNKAISLKLCRNIIIRDISILRGGHFAILATGCDNLTIDNLKIDTNRDGIDIDGCRQVRMSNCTINSPTDDGICLKSSYPLGRPTFCENITITNCQVSGFLDGSFFDGTYRRDGVRNPVGRIKFGTESNGGFKNITISNCVFEYCRGFALETVDGALLEDVAISNITMRDIVNAPIYLRLGARLRGPAETTKVGALRRVKFDNIIAHNVAARQGILIAGLPHENGVTEGVIEDVTLSNIFMDFQGGGTAKQAAREMPELEKDYPDPGRHGDTPSWALYARHAKNLSLHHVEFRAAKPDARPAIVLDDVADASLEHVKLPTEAASAGEGEGAGEGAGAGAGEGASEGGAKENIVLRNGATVRP